LGEWGALKIKQLLTTIFVVLFDYRLAR